MISGINVLNKIEITSMPDWWWVWAVIIMGVAAIIGIIASMLSEEGFCFPMCLFVGFLIFLLYLTILPSEPTGKYTYQVTVDDNVNFKEFSDKYEVIKQEGEIYYIEEKESE